MRSAHTSRRSDGKKLAARYPAAHHRFATILQAMLLDDAAADLADAIVAEREVSPDAREAGPLRNRRRGLEARVGQYAGVLRALNALQPDEPPRP